MANIYKNCSLMNNNGSVVVYYYHKSLCKYPTGVSIEVNEWDKKRSFIKTSTDGYVQKATLLRQVEAWANSILEAKYKEEEIILTGKELKELMVRQYRVKAAAKGNRLVDHYQLFYEGKRRVFSAKPQSLKDYTSLLNLLSEFEIFYERKVLLRNFNDIFLDELMEFMKTERPKETVLSDGSRYQYKTKGRMQKGTIRKRLDGLNEFFKYLERQGVVQPNDFIRKLRSEIRPSNKSKVTLTIEEVHTLYRFDFQDKMQNEVKDLFVFICFTGLRWSDIERFDSRFIIKYNDELVYNVVPKKTQDSSEVEIFIPLCDIAKEILSKYDMNLKGIVRTNQTTNECLKVIAKKVGLFNQITKIKDKNTGAYMRRYELISCHRGRDTFITNLIETTPINELMKYTGHTKVSTLMQYVDKTRKVNFNYVKIFNHEKSVR
jgi:integrase